MPRYPNTTGLFLAPLYMAVTPDEYELPIAIADSPTKLGIMVGVTKNTVSTGIDRGYYGERIGMKFVKVEFLSTKQFRKRRLLYAKPDDVFRIKYDSIAI